MVGLTNAVAEMAKAMACQQTTILPPHQTTLPMSCTSTSSGVSPAKLASLAAAERVTFII